MDKYPDFAAGKVGGYVQSAKEFTSSKPNTAGAQLQSAGTALKHLYHLQQLNTTRSLIPGTNAHQDYETQLTVLADELAKFYGTNTAEARAKLEGNLDSVRPSNRQHGITTQVHALGEKLDSLEQQWHNAAPSSAYFPLMPQIDDKAKAARAYFDPEYAARYKSEAAAQPPPRTPTVGGPVAPQAPNQNPPPPPPPEATVRVQLPGHPPGTIPASALKKFQQDHKDAQVLQ